MISYRYPLLLFALGIIGAALILSATRNYGVVLSPDSVAYILAARQIADVPIAFAVSRNLLDWPPLYPAVLAGTNIIFGSDVLVLIPYLNAALFGLIVYLGGILMFRHVRIPLLAVLGALAVLASTTLLKVNLAAWSEPLFICLLLLFLLAFGNYQTRPGPRWLGLMGIVVALACLTRYIGIILIPTGAAMILFLPVGSWRSRLAHASAFVLIAGAPIALWLARNLLRSRTLFGNRSPSPFSFAQNLSLSLDTMVGWFVPPGIAAQPGLDVLLIGALVVIGALVLRWNKTWRNTLWSKEGANLSVIVSYLVFLILSATMIAFDQIDYRLLSPLVIPLLVVVFFILGEIAGSLQARVPGRTVPLVCALGIGIWLVYPIQATALSIQAHTNEGGAGYNNKLWRKSETIQYLRAHPELASQCQIYSNGFDAIAILDEPKSIRGPTQVIWCCGRGGEWGRYGDKAMARRGQVLSCLAGLDTQGIFDDRGRAC